MNNSAKFMPKVSQPLMNKAFQLSYLWQGKGSMVLFTNKYVKLPLRYHIGGLNEKNRS